MDKKYSWLKLDKDFFKSHTTKILLARENGRDYVLIYLKLLAESIGHDGELRYSDELAYTVEDLAIVIDEDEELLSMAMDEFRKRGLMEIYDDGTIYMPQTATMIGSTTAAAEKQKRYRERQKLKKERGNAEVTLSNAEVTLGFDGVEKSLPREREREREREKKEDYHTHKVPCGKLENVYLTQEQLDELYKLIPSQADGYIERFGRYKSMKAIESHDDYAWIRGWMDEDDAIAKERRKQEAERWDAIVEEEANGK